MQRPVQYITVGYLALLVLMKMLTLPLLCLQFDLNRDYIINTLCENRDKPQMHCSGSCILEKHLNTGADMGGPQSQKSNFQPGSVDFFESIPEHLPGMIVVSAIPPNNYLSPAPANGFTARIFHPPVFS